MKKLIFILLLGFQFMNAQDTIPKSKLMHRKNEVRVDVLSILAFSKLNITYERFLNNSFSVGVTGHSANSSKVNDDFDSGNRNTIPTYEVIPFVRYNLSKGYRSFYFAEVFVDANGGDFRETVRQTDGSGNGYYSIQKTKYSDVGVGAGLGYKFYIQDRVGIELEVGFGTNLIDKDKSPDYLSRVGISVGYRF